MTALGQRVDDGVIEVLLDRQMTGIALAREERARRMAGVELRRFNCLLQVEAEVDVALDENGRLRPVKGDLRAAVLAEWHQLAA